MRWHQWSWGMKTNLFQPPTIPTTSFASVTDKENCNQRQDQSHVPLSSPILLQLRELPNSEVLLDVHHLNKTCNPYWVTLTIFFLTLKSFPDSLFILSIPALFFRRLTSMGYINRLPNLWLCFGFSQWEALEGSQRVDRAKSRYICSGSLPAWSPWVDGILDLRLHPRLLFVILSLVPVTSFSLSLSFFNFNFNLFIFGCVGSSLLHVGFL